MLQNMQELQKMYWNYKKLQDALKHTVIRAREWGILIDMTAEMNIKDIKIEDDSILTPDNKENIEEAFKNAYEKAKEKAQAVAMEKTKEILWFDPNDLAWMLWGMWWWGGWWMPKIPWFN